MPRNGAGTYNLTSGNPVTTGTTISSTWANNTLSDMASALTQSVAKDGQTVMTNNLPMGGFKLTNLGAGSNSGDSINYQQLFSQGLPTDIASAASVDIGGQNTTFLNVTGTVGITSLGSNYNGPRILKFTNSLIITHDATTLQLPDGVNITTSINDIAVFVPKSTITGTPDGWKLIQYLRNSDVAVNVASASTVDLNATVSDFIVLTGSTTITAWTLTSGIKYVYCPAGITLTYNATTNKLNTNGSNYVTAAGDILTIMPFGSTITVDITKVSGDSQISGVYPVTANATMTSSQWNGLFTNSTTSNWTVTLDSVTGNANRSVSFSCLNTGTLTVARSGSSTINANGQTAQTSIILTQGQSITLVCDGTDFVQLGYSQNAIGVRAKWQNMLSPSVLRLQNTVYTADPTKIRRVMGYLSCTTANNFQVQIDGNTMTFDSAILGGVRAFVFEVPAGSTYLINPGGFNFTVSAWWEKE